MQTAYWASKKQASSKRALEQSTLIAPTWLPSPALSAKRIFSVCPSFSGPLIISTGFWTAHDDILQSLEPHGFVGLAFFEAGARSVYTVRRPVRTIDDIKGLRIRLQQSDLMIEMFAALGAEPVVLPYTRTRTALATGLIDAAENNWPSYVASDHYSVAPYFALTEHTMTPDVLIMSMKAWSSLSPTDQNIFRNAARDSGIFLRGQWKNWEASFRKQALDSGVTVIEIDRKPLEAALTGLYTKVLTDSHSRHLVESIQKD
jgi:TRAP-type C4-dicarboxylate transport system substrate-binding protein